MAWKISKKWQRNLTLQQLLRKEFGTDPQPRYTDFLSFGEPQWRERSVVGKLFFFLLHHGFEAGAVTHRDGWYSTHDCSTFKDDGGWVVRGKDVRDAMGLLASIEFEGESLIETKEDIDPTTKKRTTFYRIRPTKVILREIFCEAAQSSALLTFLHSGFVDQNHQLFIAFVDEVVSKLWPKLHQHEWGTSDGLFFVYYAFAMRYPDLIVVYHRHPAQFALVKARIAHRSKNAITQKLASIKTSNGQIAMNVDILTAEERDVYSEGMAFIGMIRGAFEADWMLHTLTVSSTTKGEQSHLATLTYYEERLLPTLERIETAIIFATWAKILLQTQRVVKIKNTKHKKHTALQEISQASRRQKTQVEM